MRDEIASTATDATAAHDFIAQWFGATEQPAYICSIANDRSDSKEPSERHVATRTPTEVESFIARWDRPGRGLFFCVSTIRDREKRNKENVVEIPGLWADIDFKDVIDDEAAILRRVKALPKPPSTIIRSGNGLHLYWKCKEALTVNIVDGSETVERVEAALKLLADLVGGDMLVTQVANLMRLPGTHNSKRGDWKLAAIESNTGHEYGLDDIEAMLSECSPIVLRKLRPSATAAEINPFLEAAKHLGYKPPIDVENRLRLMLYMAGENGIHGTQLVVTASMLNAGIPVEEVVSLVLEATRAAAGDYGKRWNWRREENAIRGMCQTWLKKHPEEIKQAQTRKKDGDNVAKPVDIDWSKVDQHSGWLKSVADLPPNFSAAGKVLVAHTGNIDDLKTDLKRSGAVIDKPISNWTEAAFALTMRLRADGRLTTEQIAAALMCPLACNQHITRQPDEAQRRITIERLMWRTREHGAQKQAIKRAAPGEPDWRERRENGTAIPSLHNARLGINALGVECSYDTFHNKLLFGFAGDVKHEMQSLLGEVSDHSVMALRQLMSNRFGFDPTEKHVRDAVISLAIEHCFDPVRDLIDKAEADWDRVERLDHAAATHFNCADTPLNCAFIRKTGIAMVERARNPGCKFDTITVLESPEGKNKSTAWRILAGDENFSDEAIIGKGSREVQEQLAGVWIHENAELAGMRKADVDAVKAYASRTTDIARAAYGHFPIRQKRHSIDVGTTNSDEYLQSQTGNRRFWPLKLLGEIDQDLLRRDRLQLIGEAAHYQTTGESITLDRAMWGEAGIEQEGRRVKDPWEVMLATMPATVEIEGSGFYGATKTHKIIHHVDDQERVKFRDVLTYVLAIPVAHQTVSHSMRLSVVMKQVGWQKKDKVTIDGAQVRGYIRWVAGAADADADVDETKKPRF